MSRCTDGLRISGLPTRDSLRLSKVLGTEVLVNCSGSASMDIYGKELLAGLEVHDFRFPDVFTRGECLSRAIDELGAAGIDEIRRATEVVAEALRRGRRTLLFCHLGLGRSPLVGAMALERSGLADATTAMSAIRAIRPGAEFSPVALGLWSTLRTAWLNPLERRDAPL